MIPQLFNNSKSRLETEIIAEINFVIKVEGRTQKGPPECKFPPLLFIFNTQRVLNRVASPPSAPYS